jgi:hypothetical protein
MEYIPKKIIEFNMLVIPNSFMLDILLNILKNFQEEVPKDILGVILEMSIMRVSIRIWLMTTKKHEGFYKCHHLTTLMPILLLKHQIFNK